ncbi:PadR family transcriptional regulator [Micromonospora sp. HM5-17]|jgi:DNA-binding PadR family transcriptional regulator|uniref:PadR family transcriptional regulator n=1 Tax=Micromonospora sp. HM5-17 TaxID=2487710 RepID=UPI000F48F9D9|nr:PadR family transcriptional regulator [Micromonospora sp. HM5-17]ROT33283.1 PadR family transcriptional regulator [Micromonospora sp. HM5-17]
MQRNAVRWGLLALFADGPKYGYQLRTEFDARTGGTWALNVGQLYTTLERLDRDGLVAKAGTNDEGRTIYAITDKGRQALANWFATPVTDTDRPRSELAIKLAIAAATPDVDVAAVIQAQRTESMRQMRDFTDLRRAADPSRDDITWLLLLDHLVFTLESEIRWLDHVEATVLRRRRARRSAAPRAAAAPDPAAAEPGVAEGERVR